MSDLVAGGVIGRPAASDHSERLECQPRSRIAQGVEVARLPLGPCIKVVVSLLYCRPSRWLPSPALRWAANEACPLCGRRVPIKLIRVYHCVGLDSGEAGKRTVASSGNVGPITRE